MRLLALPLSSDGSTLPGGGLLLRMRARVAAMAAALVTRQRPEQKRNEAAAPTWSAPSAIVRKAPERRVQKQHSAVDDGAVVAFPLSGHTRLVQLAQGLKQPFVDLGLADCEPLILQVRGGARPCLWIDSTAYVEFRGPELGYLAVFNDAFETRMTLETLDFDAIARLAHTYIAARLIDAGCAGGKA